MAYKTSSILDFWWAKLPAVLQNKYLLCIVAFAVWLLFLDKNDVISQWKLQNKVTELKEQRAFYKKETVVVQAQIKDLLGSTKSLERFAREHYHLKRPNEEVFVIVEK